MIDVMMFLAAIALTIFGMYLIATGWRDRVQAVKDKDREDHKEDDDD